MIYKPPEDYGSPDNDDTKLRQENPDTDLRQAPCNGDCRCFEVSDQTKAD